MPALPTSENVEALHMLRKNGTRLLMNLFQLACLRQDRTDHRQMFAYLRRLDKCLGDAHDGAEGKRIANGGNYDGIDMNVSPEIRQQILEVLQFLGGQWNLKFDKTDSIPPDPYQEEANTLSV